MIEEERSGGWRAVLVRSMAPAALLLTLLLFLLLPVAGASCGPDDGGPAHLCYSGGQLISDEPDLDMSNIFAGDSRQTAELRDGILNTVALPGAAAVLALITAILLAIGVLSVAIPRPRWRAAIATGTALTAGVLMGVTELVVTNGLTDGVRFLPSFFGTFGNKSDPSDIASTEAGFWLALVAIVVAAAIGIGSMVRQSAAAFDRRLHDLDVARDRGVPEPGEAPPE